ncbi:dUTP diphosphatase [Gloeobacter violaceus]|uniref:Deoxyuridine 5'-triphosphate nucleotidohydrolase n=1 Tax=Gloeobacter violaceus (strain ATCC 29082 / PCC 7421) TaxID=251221 RepID=DUT_GLOVI|nr:dUTP diphosphatase [Gloeobacter violaceus]Q7NKL2.2 RecName: Full=Deoxyuridine 5'-triphosphate nucleotidohydrolase; Short=dUTPase; AltName: Full=dUTP pyrophosphatase [Gloeobacter violaceus PCC 7421]
MDPVRVAIQRLAHCFALPTCAHPGDAGLDLFAAHAVPLSIAPGRFTRVPTGIALGLPAGYMAFVQPRSGLAARHGISVLNTPGLIDCGYRGEIQVLLINHGEVPVVVSRGDRIAQLVVLPVPQVQFVEVSTLESSERQTGSFGSSGY